MMSRFRNGPAFCGSSKRTGYSSQQTGEMIDLRRGIECVNHNPQPLATPGHRRIEDRPDIKSCLLQLLRQLSDRRIAGDDYHLDRGITVQPLITGHRLPEPVDELP